MRSWGRGNGDGFAAGLVGWSQSLVTGSGEQINAGCGVGNDGNADVGIGR